MTTTAKAKGKSKRKAYEGPTAEEKLLAALIEVLEAGVNPWRKEWVGGGVHRNLVTGASYRGSNPALLQLWATARGYKFPLWLGAGQAKAKGWWPKKGSKGCYVLRPQLNRRELVDDQGKPQLGPDGEQLISAWTSYKPVCVFNVADLQGKDEASQQALDQAIADEMGAYVARPEPERLAAAEAVLGAWEVETVWAGDRAFYRASEDRITMPTRAQFTSAAGLYATWAHEQVHSTGHSKRLGRKLGNGKGTVGYAREELIAELGAFLVCNRLEIPSSTENHAAYLDSWLGVLQEGPKALFKALSEATKAANLICGPEVVDAEA